MLDTITSVYHPKFSLLSFDRDDVATFPSHDACPACEAEQRDRPVLRLGQPDWQKTISICQCTGCGHVYYKNPPPSEFILDFYRTLWNKSRGETVVAAAMPKLSVKRAIANMVVDLDISDMKVPILDVGCGYGAQLGGLRDAGFENFYGCEQSPYRVAAAGKRFPGRIFDCGYQGIPQIVDKIGTRFGIVCMNHVLEHIHTPADAFRTISESLEDEGVIITNVPDVVGESAINQALFLPHLHSFSATSLAALGAQLGFEAGFWNGAQRGELCCAYSRNEAIINGGKEARFHVAAPLTSVAIDAVFDKVREPWVEQTRAVVALSWDVKTSTNGRTYVRINRLQKRLLSLLRRAGSIALRLRLTKKRPEFRRTLLPLVLGKRCAETTASYLEYHNRPLASDGVPTICFVDGTVPFLIK